MDKQNARPQLDLTIETVEIAGLEVAGEAAPINLDDLIPGLGTADSFGMTELGASFTGSCSCCSSSCCSS